MYVDVPCAGNNTYYTILPRLTSSRFIAGSVELFTVVVRLAKGK